MNVNSWTTSYRFLLQNFDLDESELKNLLDEAYSYKGPKDKENKSEIFKVCVTENFLYTLDKFSFNENIQIDGHAQRLIQSQLIHRSYYIKLNSKINSAIHATHMHSFRRHNFVEIIGDITPVAHYRI